MQPLDPRVVTVWRITATISSVVVLLVTLPLDLGRVFSSDPIVPVGLPSLVVAALGFVSIFVTPGRRYRAWRYALEDDALLAEHGVWTHVRTVVPRTRVQHLDVTQGLIERDHGLARLVVHTAGTRDATVTIPGLPLETAEALRDALRRTAAED
ncbi:MAG TPA: PH domain-containing protein [Rhodothermales bacterium]|nr:PH domain-containing protein [Rhodothermales bacterium]